MKRAVIYARFSSENQHQESIEAQVAECTAYCQHQNYIIVKTYVDEALSGTESTKRKSYNAMLADARKGIFDVVIFHKIDRNARNEIDYYRFKQQIILLGLTYEYAAQPINSTPEGQFMEAVMVGQAAFYSRNLSKEMKAKLKPYAAQSQFLGGTPPYGYKIVDKQYVINEEEAPAIRLIFREFLAGRSYVHILDQLAAGNYHTRSGRLFGKNSLHDILRNQKYCGTYMYNRVAKRPNGSRNNHAAPSENTIINRGSIPAIISEEDFAMAQQVLNARRKKQGMFKAKHEYLLSGLMRCGECGSSYTGRVQSSHGKKYFYYICVDTHMHGSQNCEGPRLKAAPTEDAVVSALLDRFPEEDLDRIIAAAANKLQNLPGTDDKLKSLQNKKARLTTRMNNLYDVIEQGTADEFDLARLTTLKKDLRRCTEEINAIAAIPKPKYSPTYLKKSWEDMLAGLKQKTDPAFTRSVLCRILKSITVTKTELILTLSDGFLPISWCRWLDHQQKDKIIRIPLQKVVSQSQRKKNIS